MRKQSFNEEGMALLTATLVAVAAVLAVVSIGAMAIQQSKLIDHNEVYKEAFFGVESGFMAGWVDLENGGDGMIGLDDWVGAGPISGSPHASAAGGGGSGSSAPTSGEFVLPNFDDEGVTPSHSSTLPGVQYMTYAQDWSSDGLDNNADGIVDGPEEDSFFTLHAFARNGTVERKVEAILKRLDLNIWNNAVFGGPGMPGGLVVGDAHLHGSVHLLGDDIVEGGIAIGPGVNMTNDYAEIPAAFQERIPALPTREWDGETVETLFSTLSVKNGFVHLEGDTTVGRADESGNSTKETLDGTFVNDGWIGTTVNADGDRGEPTTVFSDNMWDVPYYSNNKLVFPVLGDAYRELETGETIMNSSTGSPFTHAEFFDEVLSDETYDGDLLISASADFYFNATTGETEVPTEMPATDEDYLWYDSVKGVLYVNGQIEIDGDFIIGDPIDPSTGHPNSGHGNGTGASSSGGPGHSSGAGGGGLGVGVGGEGNGDKVAICHIPPGNPANAHTIIVSENAIPAHLAHGDVLEVCADKPDPFTTFFYSGKAAILVHGDVNINVNLVTGDAILTEGATMPAPTGAGEVEFGYYNIDMCVGDSMTLLAYTEVTGTLQLGVDFDYVYEDAEVWHIDEFNNNTSFTLTAHDKNGGNHGDGEYRVSLRMLDTGELVDHATIRVDNCNAHTFSDEPVNATGVGGGAVGSVAGASGDFSLEYLPAPFPQNLLGIMAENDINITAVPSTNGEPVDPTLIMGALYAQHDVRVFGETTVAGTLVGRHLTMDGTGVYQVPEMAGNLPRGMIGAHPVTVFIRLAWTEIGI